MNKKSILIPSLVAGAVGTAVYFLKNDENRDCLKHNYQRAVAKVKGRTSEDENAVLSQKVGYSEPYDIEDNRMVDEGSQYSIHHFNKAQEKNEDPLETTVKD